MKLARNSSLKKLARVMAHKKLPPERAFVIENAMANAYRRRKVYENRKSRTGSQS
jgi:hypothetical protein